MPCSNCGRTFLPDRLEVHMRSCAKLNKKPVNPEDGGMMQSPPTMMSSKTDSVMGTPNLNNKTMKGEMPECTMCGRTFSKNMMEQHVKACQKRWVPGQA